MWSEQDYLKLIEYDRDTSEQPAAPFLCHDEDRQSVLCRGWFECHGTDLLAFRIACSTGMLDAGSIGECNVPCFKSGAAAAQHGISGIESPDRNAVKMINKLLHKHPELMGD